MLGATVGAAVDVGATVVGATVVAVVTGGAGGAGGGGATGWGATAAGVAGAAAGDFTLPVMGPGVRGANAHCTWWLPADQLAGPSGR